MRLFNMGSLHLRIPDEKHQRLRELAKSRNISVNKLLEELTEDGFN